METVNRGRCHSELCGEIHCAGHTATVVQNRMIVIFGHSPKLGFLDTVQVGKKSFSDPDSIRSLDPYPDSESVSGFRRAKMTH
jgi:hypothetical protein